MIRSYARISYIVIPIKYQLWVSLESLQYDALLLHDIPIHDVGQANHMSAVCDRLSGTAPSVACAHRTHAKKMITARIVYF